MGMVHAVFRTSPALVPGPRIHAYPAIAAEGRGRLRGCERGRGRSDQSATPTTTTTTERSGSVVLFRSLRDCTSTSPRGNGGALGSHDQARIQVGYEQDGDAILGGPRRQRR